MRKKLSSTSTDKKLIKRAQRAFAVLMPLFILLALGISSLTHV